jgi:hypothetical protein
VTILFHVVLIGVVFPFVVSSNDWGIFAGGLLAILVWLFWLFNYAVKKFNSIIKEIK